MFHVLSFLLLAQAPGPLDVSRITVNSPVSAAVVDMDKINGEPWRLSWAPDGQQLHLVAMKRKGDRSLDLTHHVLDANAGTVQKVDAEPPWASEYWQWKSAQAAPGKPSFAIHLDQQKKNESATARPMGGSLARGAPGSAPGVSIDDAAGQMSTNVLIITLLLKGEILGQWKDEPFVAGLTFGWGPRGTDAIAFANRDGRLVLMDEQGRKQRIDGTKDVRLPAWSGDGRQLAWIEKQDKKKWRIQIAGVM